MTRKTKIICTLGPATNDEATLRQLVRSGMNAARFNFSHGTHESHLEQLSKLKQVRAELGANVATILDTKGPEIRVKTFGTGSVQLRQGEAFTLTTREVEGDRRQVSVTYGELHAELSPGCRILLDDGLIELAVERVTGRDIHCRVTTGGTLSNNKSINIPDVPIPLPSLTEKDEADIRFGVEQGFDFIAASFVRRAEDVQDIRRVLRKWGGSDVSVIAKIENREGVDHLDEIIAAADGVMVARGDLGVEIPAHEVPILQKQMIAKTILAGKPVIIATQMLDSMIRNPRPTRAEISDVANAVFDGTSCVMLSGETASGKYPLEALRTMVDTVEAAEGAIHYWGRFRKAAFTPGGSIPDAITHTCCLTAMDLEAKAILAASCSGSTGRLISRFRPACPIIVLTYTERVRRQLALSWGAQPYLIHNTDSTDELFDMAVERAVQEGEVSPGDTVVITAGVPIGTVGSTNLIKAQKVEGNS